MATTKPKKTTSEYVVVSLNLAHNITFDIGEKSWTINGTNSNLRGLDSGILAVGQFGKTHIKREDWEAIKREYGSMTIFKKGYIFSSDDEASANAEAKEKAELRHGLEPIDTSKTTSKADTIK